jgi:hypothetical protein
MKTNKMIKNRNRLEILVMVLVFGMVFVGYVNGSTNIDFIRIINITPNVNLMDGTEQQFTVTVEYVLSSQEQAMIYIGFNSYRSNRYTFVSATPFRGGLIVSRGRGVHTFNVVALTKNWNPNGKFGVYTNLSPYPHENSWKPLAYDIKELLF